MKLLARPFFAVALVAVSWFAVAEGRSALDGQDSSARDSLDRDFLLRSQADPEAPPVVPGFHGALTARHTEGGLQLFVVRSEILDVEGELAPVWSEVGPLTAEELLVEVRVEEGELGTTFLGVDAPLEAVEVPLPEDLDEDLRLELRLVSLEARAAASEASVVALARALDRSLELNQELTERVAALESSR